MNSRQQRLLHSIGSVATLLDDRAFHTRTISPLRGELKIVLKSIRDLAIDQDVSHRSMGSDRASVTSLKTQLRTKHLIPLTRRAKLVLKGYPGIEESLRLPHARADVKSHAEASKRILRALRPHAPALVDAGFSKTVLADCDRVAKAMAQRHADPDTFRNRRSVATRSIPDAIRHAREIVDVIDSHVNAELADERALISRWRQAKRVPARMGRPRKRKEAAGGG